MTNFVAVQCRVLLRDETHVTLLLNVGTEDEEEEAVPLKELEDHRAVHDDDAEQEVTLMISQDWLTKNGINWTERD